MRKGYNGYSPRNKHFFHRQENRDTEVQLQQYGCQYLCSMAQATPDVREDILKLGGIRPIIAAMNNYPQDGCGWVARMAGRDIFFGGNSDENGKCFRCYGMSLWFMVRNYT